MNRTLIEWVKNPDGSQGYTWNPITGCLNHVNGMCKGGGFPCYAYRLANGRLKQRYLANTNLTPDAKGGIYKLSIKGETVIEREGNYADPFYPRFWPERLYGGLYTENYPKHGKPKGIFVCDMSDLFGRGVPEAWTREVLTEIELYPWHRFYLLTKQPQNLPPFSPFPESCWVGVTATNWLMFSDALGHLATIKAKVKYISFEPLLGEIKPDMMQQLLFPQVIDWLIIGAQTKPYKPPKIEWVQWIIGAADKAGIPVFIKPNLNSENLPDNAFNKVGLVRQELPNV